MQILQFIGYVLLAILAVMAAIAFGGVWLYKFIMLLIVPAAPADMAVTIENYSAYQIISREYQKVADKKYPDHFFDVIEGRTNVLLSGNLALRSDGRSVFVINKKDDADFAKKDVMRIKVEGQDWALKGCANNTKGCDVNVRVQYRFEMAKEDSKAEWTLTQPYNYDMYIRRK